MVEWLKSKPKEYRWCPKCYLLYTYDPEMLELAKPKYCRKCAEELTNVLENQKLSFYLPRERF